MSGFGNEHATEARAGALPVGQNSPQRAPLGLYAEQLSGTAFTVPRAKARRSWLYRARPSVVHAPFVPAPHARLRGAFGGAAASGPGAAGGTLTPNQLRWLPAPLPPAGGAAVDWLSGLETVAGAGSAEAKSGLAIHVWRANAPMERAAFYNADGEMLLVPQEGALELQTEFGWLAVAPGEIAVVPRGVRFRVGLAGPSRGYVLEVFGAAPFELPELGPIGSNGLANARDFLYPVAAFDADEGRAGAGAGAPPWVVVAKFGGHCFSTAQGHSPFDVVAWHGTLAPYKYDLARFNTIGTVSFDHPDPSIFTVLTVPSEAGAGVALADFVIFPPRWMVAEHTFRPPWFHRCARGGGGGRGRRGERARAALTRAPFLRPRARRPHTRSFPPPPQQLHDRVHGHGLGQVRRQGRLPARRRVAALDHERARARRGHLRARVGRGARARKVRRGPRLHVRDEPIFARDGRGARRALARRRLC